MIAIKESVYPNLQKESSKYAWSELLATGMFLLYVIFACRDPYSKVADADELKESLASQGILLVVLSPLRVFLDQSRYSHIVTDKISTDFHAILESHELSNILG